MYYIYDSSGNWCGTSETWVDMPPGYTLSTDPPPPPPPPPEPIETTPPPPPPTVTPLTEDDVRKIRARLESLNPVLPDCLELILYTVRGDVNAANVVIARIKEVIANDQ